MMPGDARRTRLLAVGLVVAVLVLFQRQLQLALEAVHAFGSRVGLALAPSAVILVVVLLPDTPRPGVLRVAESLRQQLAETSVTWNGKPVSTTPSVGLTMALPNEVDPAAVIGRADAALYRAKNGGRDRVCEADPADTPLAAAPKAV